VRPAIPLLLFHLFGLLNFSKYQKGRFLFGWHPLHSPCARRPFYPSGRREDPLSPSTFVLTFSSFFFFSRISCLLSHYLRVSCSIVYVICVKFFWPAVPLFAAFPPPPPSFRSSSPSESKFYNPVLSFCKIRLVAVGRCRCGLKPPPFSLQVFFQIFFLVFYARRHENSWVNDRKRLVCRHSSPPAPRCFSEAAQFFPSCASFLTLMKGVHCFLHQAMP